MTLIQRCAGRPVWNGIDWDECFQQRVLNASIPLALVLLSLLCLVLHQLRRRRALTASAEHVATLDPAASSFSAVLHAQSAQQANGHRPAVSRRSTSSGLLGLPRRILNAILPWNSSRILRSNSFSSVHSTTLPFGTSNGNSKDQSAAAASQAALEVFHTENAVILNEVHLTPPTGRDPKVVQQLRRLELLRRIIDVLGSVALAAIHAGDWAAGSFSRSYSVYWAGLWFYLASLSAYSLASKHSFFSHKAALMSVYVVVTLFNLRTALLNHHTHPDLHSRGAVILTAIELLVGCIVLAPALLFPLQTVLPRDLRAIYTTISPETQHGVPGTAFPSPRLTSVDDLTQPQTAVESHADASASDLIPAPEETASLLSRATFGYVTPAIVKHYKTQFTLAAIPDLPVADKAAAVVACFRAYTSARSDETQGPAHRSPGSQKQGLHVGLAPSTRPLWRRLFGHFKWFLALQFLWATLEAVLDLVPPFFLQKILAFIAARDEQRRTGNYEGAEPLHLGILYAFGMFVGQIFASISASRALFIGRRICIRLRAILITEIVTKTLRRKDIGSTGDKDDDAKKDADDQEDADDSTAAAKKDAKDGKGDATPKRATDGQVVNLISVDVFKVSEICAYLHFLAPRAPLVIGLCLVYLIVLLGWSAVIGFLVLLASLPIQTLVSRWFVKLQKRLLETTDKRLNLATEVLGCIKTVKFFAWERSFNARMDEARQRELHVLAFATWHGSATRSPTWERRCSSPALPLAPTPRSSTSLLLPKRRSLLLLSSTRSATRSMRFQT